MGPRNSMIALLAWLSAPAAVGASHGAHWAYSGAGGPAHWGAQSATCAKGETQSPVDIRTAAVKVDKLPPMAFDYRPTPLHVIDKGHTIQVDVAKGSTLAVGGVRFPLIQFHFHKPSEEMIDG